MSADADQMAQGRAMLAELKCTRSSLADQRKALARQLLDRRATFEDDLALRAADAKLAELQALIDEGERSLAGDTGAEHGPH